MPAIAAFTINDGSGTPVAYTFDPIGKDTKTGVVWYEQTTPAPTNKLGAVRIGIKTVRSANLGKTLDEKAQVSYSLWVPTLETLGTNDAGITPAPTISYQESCRMIFDLAERGTTQERKNTRVFAANLLAHANTVANIDSLSPMWGA